VWVVVLSYKQKRTKTYKPETVKAKVTFFRAGGYGRTGEYDIEVKRADEENITWRRLVVEANKIARKLGEQEGLRYYIHTISPEEKLQ